MLFLVYGTDEKGAREKTHAVLQGLFLKEPNALHVSIGSQTFESHSLDELIGGQGLFGQKYIFLFDHVFENEVAKEEVVARLERMKNSPHVFIVLERILNKTTLSTFEKYSEKIYPVILRNKPKTRTDIFYLADALGGRDKKRLWTLFQKARGDGVSDEEIHGILFWQAKNIALAKTTKSANEAGIAPFPFQKSVNFSKNYKDEEIKDILRKLTRMFHDSHRGAYELGIALERFILRI